MKGLFNFLGKKPDEMTQEERRNKSILTLSAYGLFFILILVMAYLSNTQNQNNNGNKTKNNYTDELSQKYEEIQKNNFDSNISIIADADILLVSVRRESKDKELISKKYRDEVKYYFRQGNIFYEADKELKNFELKENVDIYNGYDTTFLNIDNILEMIKSINKLYLSEEYHSIARYKVDHNKVLEVYNKFNNTHYMSNKDFNVVVDVHYNESIEKIELDLTNLYNVIKDGYEKVIYSIEFDDINKIILPDLKTDE